MNACLIVEIGVGGIYQPHQALIESGDNIAKWSSTSYLLFEWASNSSTAIIWGNKAHQTTLVASIAAAACTVPYSTLSQPEKE